MKMKHAFVLASVLLTSCRIFGAAQGGERILLPSVDLPGNNKEDGFWSAILAGSDGKVYIGTDTEGGGHAQFYIYDSRTGQIRHRANMAKLLGGYAQGIRTHAKIHSKFCEDSLGNIYFATGNMGAGPLGVDPMSWQGGHWCKYDPKTDKLEDLGLVAPHRGIYGLAIDRKNNLLIGTCREDHVLIYNIATGRTIDQGRVCIFPSSVPRTVVCDDEGNAYTTFHPDRIAKYDAKSGRLLDLSLRLPSDPNAYPVTASVFNRSMRTGFWDNKTKKIYGLEGTASILFEYDPKAGPEGAIKVLDRLLPPLDSEKVRKAHYATLTFTLGPDRKIYYMPIGSMAPEEAETANHNFSFFQWAGQAYLISYDLQTGKKQALGKVCTQDGARVIDKLTAAPSGGATTGPDGTMYFCAFVEEKNPDLVSTSFGNIPARLRLLMYKPPGQ